MKIKHGLIIAAMIIISLLAVGVASASDNASDVVGAADFEEISAVDDNPVGNVAIEEPLEDENDAGNSQILSAGDENNPVGVDEGNGNDTDKRIDWMSLYNKQGIGNNSVILNLSEFFGNDKNSSFLVLDFSNLLGEDTYDGSYLVLGLSDILGKNSTDDSSYLVLGLSSLLGGNKTDHSYLVIGASSMGLDSLGKTALVLDLYDILSENSTLNSSYLSLDLTGLGIDNSVNLDLPFILENGAEVLGIDLNKFFNENVTDLPSFLDNINWTDFTGGNVSNLSSLLDSLNWTDLFNGNYSSLVDALGLNDYFNENVTDLPSFLDNLNWADVFGTNTTDLTSLLDDLNWTGLFNGNYSQIMDALGLNNVSDLPSLLDSLNWTKIFGEDGSLLASLFDELNWTALFNGNQTQLADLLDLNDYLNGTNIDWASFLDDFDWIDVLGENNTAWSSLLDDLNWTALFNGDYAKAIEGLNWTDILGFNATDVISLFDFNMTSFFDGLNWTALFNEDYAKAFEGINWTDVLGENNTAWSSLLDDLNWTALFNGDYAKAIEGLNWTDILGFDVTNISSLFDYDLSSLFEGLNWTDILGFNASDISSLFDFNLTSLFDGLNWTDILGFDLSDLSSLFNLSSLLDKIDLSSICGGKFAFNDSVIRVTTINDDEITLTLMNTKNNGIPYSVVSYTINGGDRAYLLTNNKGEFVIKGQNNCVIDINFVGNLLFAPTNATINLKNFIPSHLATFIEAENPFTRTAVDYKAGERGYMFYFTLKDEKGNAVPNKKVKIGIDGKIYTVTTDKDGRAGQMINMPSENSYTYALCFLGDDDYASSFAVSRLIVVKKAVTITPAKTSYTFKSAAKTKTITATLKSTNSYIPKGKQVTLTIAGKTFKATVGDKGQISLNIGSITKKGTYKVAIKFAGTVTYAAANSKTITVKIS